LLLVHNNPFPKYVYHALSPESVYLTIREDAKEVGYLSYYSEASCLHGTLLVPTIWLTLLCPYIP